MAWTQALCSTEKSSTDPACARLYASTTLAAVHAVNAVVDQNPSCGILFSRIPPLKGNGILGCFIRAPRFFSEPHWLADQNSCSQHGHNSHVIGILIYIIIVIITILIIVIKVRSLDSSS